MRKTIILAGLITLGTPGAQAQQKMTCEEARDRAMTRVTIVSNSRVLMEEDLAALSVALRNARKRIERLVAKTENLERHLKEAQAASEETKATEPEPKAGDPETEAPEPETEGAKPETTDKEPTQ